MKIQLKLMLLLFGVSLGFFIACKKNPDVIAPIVKENSDGIASTLKKESKGKATTITVTHLTVLRPFNIGGTFTQTLKDETISGTSLMVVQPIGTDSIHCTQTMTTSEGSYTMLQYCSRSNMSGSWHIISGTGEFKHLQGNGTLTMMFPPNVPAGVRGIDNLTGTFWKHP